MGVTWGEQSGAWTMVEAMGGGGADRHRHGLRIHLRGQKLGLAEGPDMGAGERVEG